MLLNVSPRRRWVPDILDNEAKSPDQQIVIEYDKPNAIQRNVWQKRIAKSNPDGTAHVYVDTDVHAILKGSNVSIINLAIKTGTKTGPDGKEADDIRQVTSGEDLASIQSDFCFLLATQLSQKIMDLEITKELLKN